MTVTGPIPATALGFTLMPEHVCLNLTGDVCWPFDSVVYGGRGCADIASGLRAELREAAWQAIRVLAGQGPGA